MSQKQTLIVGIGSPHGDDQAGWRVVESLKELEVDAEFRNAKSPVDLLDWLETGDSNWKFLILCDATHGIGTAGETRAWSLPCLELDDVTMSGTHNLSLPAVLKLAQQLERLPGKVTIWTIEGKSNEAHGKMSLAVADAIATLAQRISRSLNKGRCHA